MLRLSPFLRQGNGLRDFGFLILGLHCNASENSKMCVNKHHLGCQSIFLTGRRKTSGNNSRL